MLNRALIGSAQSPEPSPRTDAHGSQLRGTEPTGRMGRRATFFPCLFLRCHCERRSRRSIFDEVAARREADERDAGLGDGICATFKAVDDGDDPCDLTARLT